MWITLQVRRNRRLADFLPVDNPVDKWWISAELSTGAKLYTSYPQGYPQVIHRAEVGRFLALTGQG